MLDLLNPSYTPHQQPQQPNLAPSSAAARGAALAVVQPCIIPPALGLDVGASFSTLVARQVQAEDILLRGQEAAVNGFVPLYGLTQDIYSQQGFRPVAALASSPETSAAVSALLRRLQMQLMADDRKHALYHR